MSNSPNILFSWIKRSFKGLGAVISCTPKARSLNPNTLWLLAWEVKFFFLSDTKVKSKNCVIFWLLLICSFSRLRDQNFNFSNIIRIYYTMHHRNFSFLFFFFFFSESELRPSTSLTMPSGRGPATPIGIGVTSSSRVNIVAKSPYGFSLSLGETPLRGFSPRSTFAYCACSLF